MADVVYFHLMQKRGLPMFRPRYIIRNWLKLLELDNYQVKCFVRNPKDIKGFRKEDTAMIDISLGEKRLEIFLNRKDRETWNERLIVHELTHVFLYRMWEFVDHLIEKGYKSRKAQEALKGAYENLEEETVDRLVAVFLKLRRSAKRGDRKKIDLLLKKLAA